MKKTFMIMMLVLACSYTVSYGQEDKKKKEATKQEKKDTASLKSHYKELGKDIKGTSEATWDEAKKTGNEAWKETKEATGNVLESIGEWTTEQSEKVKGKKKK